MNSAKVCRLVLLMSVAATSLSAEVIRIHVVDGRNGKTIPDEHVQVWVNGRTGSAQSLVPGPDGIAELEVPEGASLDVESNYYKDCRPFQKGAPRPTYSADEIRKDGVAARNTCGKVGSEARRGELLFFVRPIHGWEGMKR